MKPAFSPSELPQEGGRTAAWGAWLPSNTLLLGLAMLAVTGAAAWLSPGVREISEEALLRLGANLPQATLERGGWWRVLAAPFQLGSWLEAALFLPFFWLVSRDVERLYGRVRHLGLFVASGALGGAASLMVLHDERMLGVGAAGPAIALAACAGVAVVQGRDGAPAWQDWLGMRAVLAAPFAGAVMLGLANGTTDGVGLVTGAALGVLAGLLLPTVREPRGGLEVLMQLGAFGAALALAAAALQSAPKPSYTLGEQQAFARLVERYRTEAAALDRRFDAIAEEALAGRLTREQLGARLQAELLPDWRAAQARWAAVDVNRAIPDADRLEPLKAHAASRLAYVEASARGWSGDDLDAFMEAARHHVAALQAQIAMTAPR